MPVSLPPRPSTRELSVTHETGSVTVDGRYVSDHYPGIGRYVFNLMQALPSVAPRQHFRLLIDQRDEQTRFALHTLEAHGVELVATDANPRSLGGQLRLRGICRRLSSDLFHATHLFSAGRLSCPSVVTIYDLIPLDGPGALQSFRQRALYRVLLRRALATATHVITLSTAAARELTRRCGLPPDRITVTPPAVDISFRPATPEQVASLRERRGLPEHYVLYVGTNRPHKNLPGLVAAWERLGQRRNGHQLVIAGPTDRRYLEVCGRAQVNGSQVVVLDRIAEADLPTLYSGARLLVQPSLVEGFGLPVIEAMACGVPVACSRGPALDEASGGAALAFDPTNVDEMASASAASCTRRTCARSSSPGATSGAARCRGRAQRR